MLYAYENGTDSALVWNSSDAYSWNLSVRKDNSTFWGTEDSGGGQTGEVLLTIVTTGGDPKLLVIEVAENVKVAGYR